MFNVLLVTFNEPLTALNKVFFLPGKNTDVKYWWLPLNDALKSAYNWKINLCKPTFQCQEALFQNDHSHKNKQQTEFPICSTSHFFWSTCWKLAVSKNKATQKLYEPVQNLLFGLRIPDSLSNLEAAQIRHKRKTRHLHPGSICLCWGKRGAGHEC